MNTLEPSLEFILDRANATRAVMSQLAAPPYNWTWTGVSPGNYGNQIAAVNVQIVALIDAGTALTAASVDWDESLVELRADASLGLRLARLRFKGQARPLKQFEGLTTSQGGRPAGYDQALDFERSWKRVDPAWVFKPGLTLAAFTARREAIEVMKVTHYDAVKEEQDQRVVLHDVADAINVIAVDWYEAATATFPEDSVAGQLIRTIPTTYNPNQPPSQLVFTEQLSPAPSQGHLKWRASRGEHFTIWAKSPLAPEFAPIIEDTTETEWMGQGLAGGLWQFRGQASNQYGNGPVSEVVEVPVAVAAVA